MKGTLVPLMARAKKQIAKRAAAREERGGDRTVATNRRARREYEFLETYERLSGRTMSRGAVRYWELLGNLRWAVGCIAQAHRHLSGQTTSLELASLGRRTAEMELELLDLLEQMPVPG